MILLPIILDVLPSTSYTIINYFLRQLTTLFRHLLPVRHSRPFGTYNPVFFYSSSSASGPLSPLIEQQPVKKL